MSSVGTVRVWHREEGWGVIDCPDTLGGCWAHFSHLWHEDIPAEPGEVIYVSGGYKELFAGETVDFDWEPADQDGQHRPILHLPNHWPWSQHWLALWHNTIGHSPPLPATV